MFLQNELNIQDTVNLWVGSRYSRTILIDRITRLIQSVANISGLKHSLQKRTCNQ